MSKTSYPDYGHSGPKWRISHRTSRTDWSDAVERCTACRTHVNTSEVHYQVPLERDIGKPGRIALEYEHVMFCDESYTAEWESTAWVPEPLYRIRSLPLNVTRVCIVDMEDVHLQYELLSRDIARAALSAYDISKPFDNSLSIGTVSLGATVSLLNDLNWYLVRFADFSLIREPSISTDEWLSHDLARQIRDGKVQPEDTDDHLAIYGVENDCLAEPILVTRVDSLVPNYGLRSVERTLVIRMGGDEFGR